MRIIGLRVFAALFFIIGWATSAVAGAEDQCEAVALNDVPAIEQPDSVKKQGEKEFGVTQYRVDKATGTSSLCSHGGYCYPTRVKISGVLRDGLALTNCTVITKDPYHDSGLDIYSLDEVPSLFSPPQLAIARVAGELLNLGFSEASTKIAYLYVLQPKSLCAKLVKNALAGNKQALDKLQSSSVYCDEDNNNHTYDNLQWPPISADEYYNAALELDHGGSLGLALTDYREAAKLYPEGNPGKVAALQRVAALEKKLGVLSSVATPAESNRPGTISPTSEATDLSRRVALVIGNGAYASPLMAELANPPHDAEAMARILKKLGFDVDVVTDATKQMMEDAIARLARKARDADVTLLFYAGHGLQDQGKNYLAPVDATLSDETDLRRRFVRLDDVLGDLADAQGARILILDACRDNRAIEALRAAVPKNRAAGVSRGLARVPEAEGLLVAFATQPDRVAADGEGADSPFTTALITHLAEPGVELRTVLTRVRRDVAKATNNHQIPEVSDSLLTEVYFHPR
jgi:hypothetical protein